MALCCKVCFLQFGWHLLRCSACTGFSLLCLARSQRVKTKKEESMCAAAAAHSSALCVVVSSCLACTSAI